MAQKCKRSHEEERHEEPEPIGNKKGHRVKGIRGARERRSGGLPAMTNGQSARPGRPKELVESLNPPNSMLGHPAALVL